MYTDNYAKTPACIIKLYLTLTCVLSHVKCKFVAAVNLHGIITWYVPNERMFKIYRYKIFVWSIANVSDSNQGTLILEKQSNIQRKRCREQQLVKYIKPATCTIFITRRFKGKAESTSMLLLSNKNIVECFARIKACRIYNFLYFAYNKAGVTCYPFSHSSVPIRCSDLKTYEYVCCSNFIWRTGSQMLLFVSWKWYNFIHNDYRVVERELFDCMEHVRHR